MQETQERQVWSLGWKDPLEEGMVTHSSTFAWRISWIEEPGRLQPMESQRVGHDRATNTLRRQRKLGTHISTVSITFGNSLLGSNLALYIKI